MDHLIGSGKKEQLKNAIDKFRQNKKIIDIQRNFLKRLLLSKAGMVVIAFHKIMKLPVRIDM